MSRWYGRQLDCHPGVRIAVENWGNRVVVEYRGEGEALVAAGVATAEMIAPGRKGVPRVDHEGYRFQRTKRGRTIAIRYTDVDVKFAAYRPGVSNTVATKWSAEPNTRRASLDEAFARFMDNAVWRMHRLLTRPGGIFRDDASTDG
jgi:hypothetical protein